MNRRWRGTKCCSGEGATREQREEADPNAKSAVYHCWCGGLELKAKNLNCLSRAQNGGCKPQRGAQGEIGFRSRLGPCPRSGFRGEAKGRRHAIGRAKEQLEHRDAHDERREESF